ncbi:hypothetical protein MKX01_017856 [Papaver californicum]|nr:hypothetical protein MKX01_017856 [Papaver californicum]
MKLKINKACDLNSISVLPPHSRRPNGITSGSDSSIFVRRQLRSQQPSQGMSSQLSQLMSSQLSQNSIDNMINNEQRFASQERENSAKRISCLAPSSLAREETQMARSFNNYKPRWGSAPPPVTDHPRCQVSDELEHRIGQIETTQNRHGMILESMQGDIMQLKKQMQEHALDIEGIKQKLAGHDNSLQLVLKGEEDIKNTLDESFKSLPDHLRKEVYQDIVSAMSTLQNQNEKLRIELSGALANSVKEITSCLQPLDNNESVPSMLKLKKRDCYHIQSQNMEPAMNSAVLPQRIYTRSKRKPEKKAETRRSSKQKPDSFAIAHQSKVEVPDNLVNSDEEWKENNESDVELNGGFAFLLGEKETGVGSSFFDEDHVETEQILKKARRRNRKLSNVIVLN